MEGCRIISSLKVLGPWICTVAKPEQGRDQKRLLVPQMKEAKVSDGVGVEIGRCQVDHRVDGAAVVVKRTLNGREGAELVIGDNDCQKFCSGLLKSVHDSGAAK